MTKLTGIYKCALCGNIVEVIHQAGGELVCCNQSMSLIEENSTDAATEKHVPVIENTDDGIKVSVGTVLHPMTEDHYIELIEIVADGKVQRQVLKPGDEPTALFCCVKADSVSARAYCNMHGLWKS
ncbi:MAG: desulfoferrodoxin [Kiritimatiellae bacterium]|nr:desulfoferrodoxin [Kiritimatiellia bacterium]